MKIIVKTKPRAKEEKVELICQELLNFGGKKTLAVYKVSVKEPPVHGRANEAVINALSNYFGISSTRICLEVGRTTPKKLFTIR